MASNKTFDPKPQLERLLTPALAPHGFVFQKGRLSWKRPLGDESLCCAIKFWRWPWDEFLGSSFCVEMIGSWPGESARQPNMRRLGHLLLQRERAAVERCYRAMQQELRMPPDGWFVGREDLRSYYERQLTPVALTRFDDLWCPFREAMHVERWAVVLAPILIAAGERFVRGAPRTEAPRRQTPRLRTSRSNRQERRQR